MSSTPRKYLSLEETAARLSVSTEELVRMREQGEVRGFADRGTWKFRVEDVDEVLRSRQADSAPDVPLLGDDEDLGEQPTVIRKSEDVSGTSDSDVKLVSGGATSDSDVKLVGDSESEMVLSADDGGSDSDVKLVGTDSDSEVVLGDDGGSDSDVKLVGQPAPQGSDSDVQLIDTSGPTDKSSDSDVALVGGSDSAIALDLVDDSEQASVLSDDIGLAIENESSLTLAADSGISLEADSGITLEQDEGITLEASDSGISLESIADSGISLEDSDEFTGTVPMMDAVPDVEGVDETKFEIPSMSDDDSAFELQMKDSGEETGVLELEDSGETMLDDAVFDLDDDEVDAFDDELEVAPDILGEDDELDELEVFDADEGLFEESGVSQEFAAPVGGPVAMEQEWGAGLVVGLAFSAAVMLAATLISFDLVRSMWGGAADAQPWTSALFR